MDELEPLTLAWRLDKIAVGDAYLETAHEVMKAIAEEELEDNSREGSRFANELAQTTIMAAQACYMAANIHASEPKVREAARPAGDVARTPWSKPWLYEMDREAGHE